MAKRAKSTAGETAVENQQKPEKESRTRAWTFVLYEESAPEQWREKLDDLHVPWIESPWHDQDINGDGSPKKKHKHVVIVFDGVKAFDQVKELTDSINCPIPQRCHSMRGSVRYMAHLDNPEKAQYNTSDIVGHQGADVDEWLKPSMSERYELIDEMMAFCVDNDILDFHMLVDIARSQYRDTWFPMLCDNSAYIMKEYLHSRRNSTKVRSEISIKKDKGSA